MPALKLEQIGGQLPAWDDHLLPAGQAAEAVNLYAFRGRMEGWRQPKYFRTLQNSAALCAYRVIQSTGTQAVAFLLFVTQPNNGDSVTIDEFTYTFRTAISNPYDVLIGATAVATATNFLQAITADYGTQQNMGTNYGQGTQNNPILNNTGLGNIITGVTALQTCYTGYAPLGAGGTYLPFTAAVGEVQGTALNNIVVSTTAPSSRLKWISNTTTAAAAFTLSGGTNPALNTNFLGATSTWVEFLDRDTDFVRTQVSNDTFERYYAFSPSQVPTYNSLARILAGQPFFRLGLNPPTIAPVVQPTGGGPNSYLPSANVNGSGTTTTGANVIYLQPVVTNGAGTISNILFVPGGTDAAVQFAAVIYEDAGNGVGPNSQTIPGALYTTGSTQIGISSGVVAVAPFNSAIQLNANTPYWIGIAINTSETINKSAAGTSTSYKFTDTFANGAINFAPSTGSTNQADLQMVATFVSSAVLEARSYVYTYVSAYYEESAPSPFTLANGFTNATWQINMSPPPLADMGTTRNIAFYRIYRTITGTDGVTSYFWVQDVPITQNVYYDNLADNQVALNIQLPSVQFFPPPDNLQGVISLPNGVLAGFAGKTVWFSQPFLPHAWPAGTTLSTEYEIIGLGFTNGAIVVCTAANPYMITGTTPGQMTITKYQLPEPCSSKASILSLDVGVYYSSPNGLIQCTNQGTATNTTELWITREKWLSLTPQTQGQIRAVPLASCYFCYGTDQPSGPVTKSPNGFAIEINQDNTSFTIWPQPGGHRVGFTQLSGPNGLNVDNVQLDRWSGVVYTIQNGNMYFFDFSDQNYIMMPWVYRSKIYQQNAKRNFSALRAFWKPHTTSPPINANPNTAATLDPSWNALQPQQAAIVQVYCDVDGTGNFVLTTTRELVNSGQLLRLLGGFKAEQWQFRFLGQVPISNVQIATTIKELGNV